MGMCVWVYEGGSLLTVSSCVEDYCVSGCVSLGDFVCVCVSLWGLGLSCLSSWAHVTQLPGYPAHISPPPPLPSLGAWSGCTSPLPSAPGSLTSP